MARLGDYVNIKTGKLDANASSDSGIYPFFTCSKEPLKIETYSYDCECVLVAGNGDLNVKYYFGKFDAYQRTYIIESKNKEKLSVRFLFYFLDKYVDTLREQSIGGVIKYIKLGNLTEAIIPLPPLEEQRKIAAVLDKVNDLIAKRREQLDKLDLLVKSKFIEMFADKDVIARWTEATIESISTNMRTGPFGSALHHDEFVDEGVFVLGIDNAVENKFSYNRMRYITAAKYQQLKRYTVKPGDVIITIMGTVGRSAVIPDDMPTAINTKHLACISLDRSRANPYFLSCAFQIHPQIQQQLRRQTKGAIMDGLNLTIIKKVSFALPPLNLQEEFVEFYNQTEKSKAIIQQSLEKLETLKKSLMQEYFG